MKELLTRIVSVSQMRAIEAEADHNGYTYSQMMEVAGRGVALHINRTYLSVMPRIVMAIVGSGNNGGDALVALSALLRDGWQARAYLARPRPFEDPLIQRLLDAGGELAEAASDQGYEQLDAWLMTSTVLVDGLLGTGAHLPLSSDMAALLGHVASRPDLPPVVAVDCPSGVDCDSGEAAPETVKATITVCMEAIKTGLLKFPAFGLCGQIETAPLGLPEDLPALQEIDDFAATREFARAALPARRPDSHKGTFGTAVIAAGSLNYTGAAYLAASAAYRAGAGLVRIASIPALHIALSGRIPEAVWTLLPEENGAISHTAAPVLLDSLEHASALLVGPGLGAADTTCQFVREVIQVMQRRFARNTSPALVIDADGLNALAALPDFADSLPPDTILTPHPGEMSRLCGLSVAQIQEKRVEVAREWAARWRVILVLKGALSVVALPEGQTVTIPGATPALARAGTGDVLAGLLTGLLAQGVPARQAAVAGAWIHLQSGLLAEQAMGQAASVLAGDVLAAMPGVLTRLAA